MGSIKQLAPGVVANPEVGFGRPCIEGTGIATEVVADRFKAGESVWQLMRDYDVTPSAIQDAIRYETNSIPKQGEDSQFYCQNVACYARRQRQRLRPQNDSH